jgi:hypothetical protein
MARPAPTARVRAGWLPSCRRPLVGPTCRSQGESPPVHPLSHTTCVFSPRVARTSLLHLAPTNGTAPRRRPLPPSPPRGEPRPPLSPLPTSLFLGHGGHGARPAWRSGLGVARGQGAHPPLPAVALDPPAAPAWPRPLPLRAARPLDPLPPRRGAQPGVPARGRGAPLGAAPPRLSPRPGSPSAVERRGHGAPARSWRPLRVRTRGVRGPGHPGPPLFAARGPPPPMPGTCDPARSVPGPTPAQPRCLRSAFSPAWPRCLLAVHVQLGPGVRVARSRHVSMLVRCGWCFGAACRALGATHRVPSRVTCSSTPRHAHLPLATRLPPCILHALITSF